MALVDSLAELQNAIDSRDLLLAKRVELIAKRDALNAEIITIAPLIVAARARLAPAKAAVITDIQALSDPP